MVNSRKLNHRIGGKQGGKMELKLAKLEVKRMKIEKKIKKIKAKLLNKRPAPEAGNLVL